MPAQGPPRHQPRQDRVRPRRDHRRQPGRRQRRHRLQHHRRQDRLRPRRHADLRQGPRRRASRMPSPSSAARSPSTDGVPDTTTDFTSYVTKREGPQPRRHLLRRRHDVGPGPVPQADGAAGPATSRSSAATASTTARLTRPARSSTSPATAPPTPTAPSRRSTTSPNPAKFAADYKAKFNDGSGRLQRPGLRLHADLPRGPQGRRRQRRWRHGQAARGGPRLHRGPGQHVRHRARQGRLRRERRHDPAHRSRTTSTTPTAKDWKFLKQRDFTADPVK